MSGHEVGERVMAMSHSKDGKVFIFGEGEYLGDLVPGSQEDMPEPVGFVASLRDANVPNPCVKLDNGKYVWGCECWWGPVESVKKKFADSEFVTVDIDESRKRATEEAGAQESEEEDDQA